MTQLRILLLDKEEISAHYFSTVVKPLPAEIIRCQKVAQVLSALTQDNIALIVIDIRSLPPEATRFWQRLRKSAPLRPIIALSTQHDMEARLALWKAGVDDIILKPFHPKELCARLGAQLRQYQSYLHALPSQRTPLFTVSKLTLDTDTFTARYQQHTLPLSKTEFRLLHALAIQSPNLCTRDALYTTVWPTQSPGSPRTLDQYISRLRKHLKRLPDQRLTIETVHHQGYRLKTG
jgi:DNA-binding response OmpR family regulator